MMKRSRDYLAGDDTSPSERRGWRVIHQSLVITQINIKSRSLMAFVDLRVKPLDRNLKVIRLNARQLKIYGVRVNNHQCKFTYVDPSSKLAKADSIKSFNYIKQCFESALTESDPDRSHGELTIELPEEIREIIRSNMENPPTLSITVEYTLEKPRGGLQFITGPHAHCYTFGESRLWFPCVDTNTELCTWTLEFTVDASLIAVSCGELTETTLSQDNRTKTFHYKLTVPTSAPNVGLAIGPFEIHVDRAMPEMTHFCIPGLVEQLVLTTGTTYQVIEYLEDLLSARFPYALYKQVFVLKLPEKSSSYASMTLFNNNLLYNDRVLNQVVKTRKIIARAISNQYFGCFMVSGKDGAWLPPALSGYLWSLWLRKTFGNSEYRHFIFQETQKVCKYEDSEQQIVLSLTARSCSARHRKMMAKKGHLVLRMFENRLTSILLLQAVNKLLTIARQDGKNHLGKHLASKLEKSPQLITSSSFQKFIFSVTGKDIKDLLDLWVKRGGVAHINASFTFDRKRNSVEVEIRQDHAGSVRYVGPMTVRIQELDGTFNHTVQVEEKTTKINLSCHSRARRNKKKKIPLLTAEEADLDLSQSDQDSPLLWLRLDPDCNLIRTCRLRQPDYCLQYMVRYERDVIGQMEALTQLPDYPTENTVKALKETIECLDYFWRVRCAACQTLSRVANSMPNPDSGKDALLQIFKTYFCLSDAVSKDRILRRNDFSNFQQYFVQCELPSALAKIRMPSGMTPHGISKFIESLIKFNDNSKNAYLDCYWKATLVEALANTLSRGVQAQKLSVAVDEAKSVINEVIRVMNVEWLLPTYRHTTFISALHAVRTLQKQQHIPSSSEIFIRFSEVGHFSDVRVAAIVSLVDFVKIEKSNGLQDFERLLKMASTDPESIIRYKTLRVLTKNPPFRKTDFNSKLNTISIRKQLWQLISEDSACDTRVRCCAIDLWKVMFGDCEFDKDNHAIVSSKHSDDDGDGKSKKKKKRKKEKKNKKDKDRKEEKSSILSSPDNMSWM